MYGCLNEKMANRNYDSLLLWLDEVVGPEEVFDRVYGAEQRTKSASQRWENFKDEVLSKIQIQYLRDGNPEGKIEGIRKAVDVLFGKSTDLPSESSDAILKHPLAESFNKALIGNEFEKKEFDPFIENIESPKRKIKEIPDVLSRDINYSEFIEEEIEDAIEDLPIEWREGVRRRIPKEYRPARNQVGLRTETVRTPKGIEMELDAEDAAIIRRDYGIAKEEPIENVNLNVSQLEAMGAKRKK